MTSSVIVDYEPGDAPDPGSFASMVTRGGKSLPNPTGSYEENIPTVLVVAAPGQREKSDPWILRQAAEGWIHALGHGVVLNKISVSEVKNRKTLFDPLTGQLKQRVVDALAAVKQMKAKYIYEVIIGQHRTYLAEILGLDEIAAYVVNGLSEEDCAWLFVQDARTTRPLRGYDIHQAAMVRGESRALLIQEELDDRGIKLVPASAKPYQVSCIRALEKACGDKSVSVSHPDKDLLNWHLDVLQRAFPTCQWNDAIVQGLTFTTSRRDVTGADPAVVANYAIKRWRSDMKTAVESVRAMRKVTSSPNPQAASEIWNTMFDASGIPLKPDKPKTTVSKKATAKKRLVRS
jgi:hypothetical protein